MKYDLGIGIPYYKQNNICEVCFNYLYEILQLQLEKIKDEKVKLFIYENNEGISKAKNVILDNLKDCKYITFIDSDDRVGIDYIETILKEIKNNDPIYQVRFHILKDIREDSELKNRNTGVIYRNDIINSLRFNENRNYGEDKEFNDNLRNFSVKLIDTDYYYNFGVNNDCISYKHSRGELEEFK